MFAEFSFFLETGVDKLLEVLQFVLGSPGNLVPEYGLLKNNERDIGGTIGGQ